MQRLRELGVRRLSWGYCGDGHGGMLNPTGYDGGDWRNWKMYDPLKQCDGLKGEALLAKIAEVRGQAYTEFLRQCKKRPAAAGKRMRYNLQMDWLRPDRPADRAPAYPANINWEWPK
jgi:hypothetical protein